MLWLLLCVSSASIRAEPIDARSPKQIYDGALTDYKAQRFEPAAQGFQRAYDLRPQPLLLFNIAQCRRKLGQFEEARAMYRRYLDIAPATESAATIREAHGFVAEIDAYLAAREPVRPAPVPPARPPPVAKVEPVVAPAPPPAPAPKATTPPAGTVTVVDKTPAPKRPLRKNPWLWTGVTVGVLAIGLGVGLGIGLTRTHASSDLGTQSPAL